MEIKVLVAVLLAIVVYTLAYLHDKNRQDQWLRLFTVTVAMILVFYMGAGGNLWFFLVGLVLVLLVQWALDRYLK